jgi:transposase
VATALVAEIGDWKAFRSGRNLAAWIGLVSKQHSTAGKERLGRITKQAIVTCDGFWSPAP